MKYRPLNEDDLVTALVVQDTGVLVSEIRYWRDRYEESQRMFSEVLEENFELKHKLERW